jgi:hypothetical protein
VGEGLGVTVGVGIGDWIGVGVSLEVGVGVIVTVTVGVGLGDWMGVGVVDGVSVGISIGVGVGLNVGVGVIVGDIVDVGVGVIMVGLVNSTLDTSTLNATLFQNLACISLTDLDGSSFSVEFPTIWKFVNGTVIVCEPFNPLMPRSATFAIYQLLFCMKIIEASSSPLPNLVPWRLNVMTAFTCPERLFATML